MKEYHLRTSITYVCFITPESFRSLASRKHHTANVFQTWNKASRKEALLPLLGIELPVLPGTQLCPFKTLLNFPCVDDHDSTFDLKIL